MKLKVLFLVLALAFAGTVNAQDAVVVEEGPPLVPEFNREQRTMTIRVFVYDTHEQVTEAKRKLRPQDRQERLLGWSTWGSTEVGVCELHVARADAYMDQEFAIWGHELGHCLYGNFHRGLDILLENE